MSLGKSFAPKDVAAYLDVSYVTVMKYIKDGKLPAIKVGGRWMITPAQLELFLRRHNSESKSSSAAKRRH